MVPTSIVDWALFVPAVVQQEMRSHTTGTSSTEMREICQLDAAAKRTLEMAVKRLALSVRAQGRILKVARTIADLGGSEQIQAKHIAEAVQYRSLDREYRK
jgi:magnesium chelatase family protein